MRQSKWVGWLLAMAMCGCSGGADTGAANASANASADRAATPPAPATSVKAAPANDLPTLQEIATQPQPELPMVERTPLVQTFAPGQVTLSSPQLTVQVDRVTYTPYGVQIQATVQQHVRVSGGGLYLNYLDQGVLRDDTGQTYRLRDPGMDLETDVADKGARWKVQLIANGFLPPDVHRLDLSLNLTNSPRDALVHASWDMPAGWAASQQGAAKDQVTPGRGWRFGTPPASNSPGGTGSMRVFGVHWLEDGIAVDVEAVNSDRHSRIQLNSGPWSTRLVDDHNRIYRIVQPQLSRRALGIGNGNRASGHLLFAPQIAPDATRLRLLINGGPDGDDPWAPLTAKDDNALSPAMAVAFDIPPAALPGLPIADKQNLALNIPQAPLHEAPLAVSTIDPIARLKRDLGATDAAHATVVELPGDVLFDFDKATLRADARPTLDKLAELITRMARPTRVAGYTDDKGEAAYNRKLSLERAQAVRDALVSRGVDRDRLTTAGYGEDQPKAPNHHPDGSDNPQGRQRNRRVEVTIDTSD